MAIRRSSCIPDSTWKTTSKRTSFRTTRWCWGTLRHAVCATYGCIQDADAQREGINASARYPKNWVTTGDPAREFTMIQSAPLMLLADPDAFVSVQLA
ncbi:major head protein [Escherichia coli]|nr:major head protein [Escherichia coli]